MLAHKLIAAALRFAIDVFVVRRFRDLEAVGFHFVRNMIVDGGMRLTADRLQQLRVGLRPAHFWKTKLSPVN
jgi:hypothetical protein